MTGETKKLGFGLMRLPRKDGAIDIPTTAAMADRFLAEGFTYLDTAYVYEGSEAAFRQAIGERHPRDSYTLADKLPSWHLSAERSPEQLFQESLDRCGVTYFDYYLLHNLNGQTAPKFDEYGCWDFLRRLTAQGKVRHPGFSFHGTPELLEELLNAHPEVEFVQLQINYVDWEDPRVASRRCYEIARAHDKQIVIMEPLKGGRLARPLPAAAKHLEDLGTGASPASYALRYAASLPGVLTVLSGMSDLPQMEDNLASFRDFRPLSDAERAAVLACRDAILSVETIPCTACRYCTAGCPAKIDIPGVFNACNSRRSYGDVSQTREQYDDAVRKGGRAADCVQCGQCESVCPQHLEIIELLRAASQVFD